LSVEHNAFTAAGAEGAEEDNSTFQISDFKAPASAPSAPAAVSFPGSTYLCE
jgi:hypothetical protein